MKEYDHNKLEKKWQSFWEKKGIYHAENNSKKPKYYSLIEFPYPSGDGLHVGHPRPYIGMDVISRKKKMEGFNVLYPIGWDAFGLPTENYAIKTGKDPRVVTKQNSNTFRRQIKSLGISFDWSREVNTTDPKYYKWTQWIFLQFLKKGLAYKAKMAINWCPKDKIGLANEEVVGGACERCGTLVEKREKEQWMLAITKYAERLDKDLDTVDYLPQIKLAQRNWIGKSEGLIFSAKVKDTDITIETFSAHFEACYADTFFVIAPDHPLLPKILQGIKEKDSVLKKAKEIIEKRNKFAEGEYKEIEGVFTGRYAIDPLGNGDLPIWVASFALKDYGTGIVKCSAHDERDFAFAKKYNISLKKVIEPLLVQDYEPGRYKKGEPIVPRNGIIAIVKHWSEDKYMSLKWKKVAWHTWITGGIEKGQTAETAAINEIKEETGYLHPKFIRELGVVHGLFYHVTKQENRLVHGHIVYFELQDGAQEEVSEKEKAIHDLEWLTLDELKKVLTADTHQYSLDVFMDQSKAYFGNGILTEPLEFKGREVSEVREEIANWLVKKGFAVRKITFKLRDWIFSRQRYWGEPIPVVHCVNCGIVPVPEKDLPIELPKVKNYQPTESGESPLANIEKWVNTKCPKCKGKAKRETDTMPNWAGSSWYYLRYTDHKNTKEFASKKNLKYWTPVNWYNGGNEHTTLHLLYSRFWHKFLFDQGLVPTSEPYKKRTSHGMILGEGGVKMSKSLGNVINPDEIVKIYGADTLRLYEMFMGPFDQAIAWSNESIIGPRRFLEKVWRIASQVQKNFAALPASGLRHGQNFSAPASLTKLLHKTIKKVTEDIENMSFNTAISSMMILATEMERTENISRENFKIFLQLLSPFAPHIAEELWSILGEKQSIHLSSWPSWDESLMEEEEIKIVIQINGKVREEIMITKDDNEELVKKQALSNEIILRHIANKEIKKVIYVKNRLINIVI